MAANFESTSHSNQRPPTDGVTSHQQRADEILEAVCRVASNVARLHAEGRLHFAVFVGATALDEVEHANLPTPPPEFNCGHDEADDDVCPPEILSHNGLCIPSDLAKARILFKEIGLDRDPTMIDLYQLGTLLCRLLTGEPVRHYMYSPRTKAKVPAAIQPVLERALGSHPTNCFQSVDEFIAGVRQSGHHTIAPPEQQPAASHDLNDDTAPSVVSPAAESDTSIEQRQNNNEHLGSEAELPFETLGHYTLISRIGQGGMGDVFKGYESALDRTVAIKVLPLEFGRHSDFVRRFHAEATAAARINHANVIEIHFIGEDRGHHYFAMQLVDGESLADLIAKKQRLSIGESMPIIVQTLSGLAAAHQQNLVHRDIKPGNILIDRVNDRALVADFGLVKSLQTSEAFTATGMVMGTVDYISPEQGRGAEIDARSDLYSMGVVVYQMLSGRLPFQAGSPTAMIFQHVYEVAQPLCELEPDIPPVLSMIVARSMEKDPGNRYQTAEEFLSDLQAFSDGKPLPSGADIITVDDSEAESPKPKQSAQATRFAQTVIIEAPQFTDEPELPDDLQQAAATGWWHRLKIRITDSLRQQAPEVLDYLQNTQQQIDGAVEEYARRHDELVELKRQAEEVLDELQTQAAEWKSAADQADHLAATAKSEAEARAALETKARHKQTIDQLEQQILQQEEQLDSIRFRLAKTSSRLEQLRSQRDMLNARLKVARARLRLAGGRVPGRRTLMPIPQSIVGRIALAVACMLTLSAGTYLTYRTFVSAPSKGISKSTANTQPPDQSVGGATDSLPDVRSADISPRFPLRQLVSGEKAAKSVAFSFDGKLAVSGGDDGVVRVWNVGTGQVIKEFENSFSFGSVLSVGSVAFSHNNKYIASGSSASAGKGEETLKIWNVEQGQIQHILPGPTGIISSLTFSHDDQFLIAVQRGSNNKELALTRWSVEDGNEVQRQLIRDVSSSQLSLGPGGGLLATGGLRTVPDVFDLQSGSMLPQLQTDKIAEGEVRFGCLAFAPSSPLLAVGDRKGNVLIWNVRTGKLIEQISGFENAVVAIAFGPDERRLAVASSDKPYGVGKSCATRIWDRATRRVGALMEGQQVRSMAFSPDGRQLLTAGQNPPLLLWDAKLDPAKVTKPIGKLAKPQTSVATKDGGINVSAEGTLIQVNHRNSMDGPQSFDLSKPEVLAIAISNDEQHAAIAAADNSVSVIDLKSATLQTTFDLGGNATPSKVAANFKRGFVGFGFAPNDRSILIRTSKMLIISDLEEKESYGVNIEATSGWPKTANSPDGQYRVTGSWDRALQMGDLRLFDTRNEKLILRFIGHVHYVWGIAISPDSRRLLSGGKKTMHLWDLTSGEELQRFEVKRTAFVSAVAFSRNGRFGMSGGNSRVINLWDLTTGEELAELTVPDGERSTLAFATTPKDRFVVSAHESGATLIWPSSFKYQQLQSKD